MKLITSPIRWETLADIKDRTRLPGKEILAAIRAEMRDKTCDCRLSDDGCCKIPEFKRKP